MFSPHDPEVLDSGNILVVDQGPIWAGETHDVVEIDPTTDEVVWRYAITDESNWPVRDADRLENGNTLITGSSQIVEVTEDGEIVWRFLNPNADKRGHRATIVRVKRYPPRFVEGLLR